MKPSIPANSLLRTGRPIGSSTNFPPREQRVVISKETDFYYSHLLQQRPYKLVLVRTGNIRTRECEELFQRQLPAIVEALANNSLVELDRVAVQVVV
jgi:predicted nuclease of predicted toxin-antitoxin system